MSDRQPPSEATKAMVQGVGMLGLIVVGIFVMDGLRTGSIRPVEIAADIPVWKDTILGYVPLVLGSAAVALVSVLCAILAARHGRGMVKATAAVWWRYRRRWADVMTAAELAGKPTKNGAVPLPVLRGVALGPDADVLTVTMLPGQSPADWDRRATTLAHAFGAASGRIQITAKGAGSDIDVILERSAAGGGDSDRKALPAPASATLPGLVLDPAQAGARREQVAVRAWSLQIVWARIRVGGDNETGRWWFGGRVRWHMLDRSGYYMVGGA